MNIEEFAKKIGIKTPGSFNEEDDSYVIDLPNSDSYGYAYIKLENCELLDLMEENQVVTEEGSSLVYEAIDEPFLVSLLADWTADIYQIVIARINIYDERERKD